MGLQPGYYMDYYMGAIVNISILERYEVSLLLSFRGVY